MNSILLRMYDARSNLIKDVFFIHAVDLTTTESKTKDLSDNNRGARQEMKISSLQLPIISISVI